MSDITPCGCCDGITAVPVTIDNRPGLSAISYRSGTWAQFKADMLDALSLTPALAGLGTRSDDDFTIALLDAWAVVCDILTFYQERIANESYLRTATELVSVGELAKLIGYKLRPGLAASTALAFTIATPPPTPPHPSNPPSGAPTSVVLATGNKAQSVPDPGMLPATFETVTPITARAEWNAIGMRVSGVPSATAHNSGATLYLSGLVPTLRTGDSVLVVINNANKNWWLNRIVSVTQDPATMTTTVTFEGGHNQQGASLPTAIAPSPSSSSSLNDDFVWAYVRDLVWPDQTQLVAFATAQGWPIDDLEDGINALQTTLRSNTDPPFAVYAMGIDACLFGHNAVRWTTIPQSLQCVIGDWDGYTLADVSSGGWVQLDNVYPVVSGDRVVLSDAGSGSIFATTVTAVAVVTVNGFLMSSKVTAIQLGDTVPHPTRYGFRTTRIQVETAQFPIAGHPLTDTVSDGPLMLEGAYLTLAAGQMVVLTGVLADQKNATASEVLVISHLSLVDGYTVVTFSTALAGTYLSGSVTLDANVAPATHGETTMEILGNGDAAQTFQRFALKQPPLTYVSAATPSGSASTLTVRVNGVAWTEVEWLYGSGPTDQVYTVLQGVSGSTIVQFGDGVTGARLATGTSNVQATYRHGIGASGVARAGQISMLLSRPLGLQAVTNPIASSGAFDPETIDQARPNAPTTVKTIERIVTLEDVGDFAAASAGIAKASGDWVWDGSRFVACVTAAGVAGAGVTPGSPQFVSLLQAMGAASDGTLPITLCSFVPVSFMVAATITPDPTLVATDVLAAVKTALATTFSFANRRFAQPVFSSEVIAAVQNVAGVVAMTLDDFNYTAQATGSPVHALVAPTATLGAQGLIGAWLLTLETGPLPQVVLAV